MSHTRVSRRALHILCTRFDTSNTANSYLGVARVWENSYVDSCLDSFDNESDASTVARDIFTLLDQDGFGLTKWLSTSRRLLEDLPLDRCASLGLDLKRDALPTEKTLGLHWDAERYLHLQDKLLHYSADSTSPS